MKDGIGCTFFFRREKVRAEGETKVGGVRVRKVPVWGGRKGSKRWGREEGRYGGSSEKDERERGRKEVEGIKEGRQGGSRGNKGRKEGMMYREGHTEGRKWGRKEGSKDMTKVKWFHYKPREMEHTLQWLRLISIHMEHRKVNGVGGGRGWGGGRGGGHYGALGAPSPLPPRGRERTVKSWPFWEDRLLRLKKMERVRMFVWNKKKHKTAWPGGCGKTDGSTTEPRGSMGGCAGVGAGGGVGE